VLQRCAVPKAGSLMLLLGVSPAAAQDQPAAESAAPPAADDAPEDKALVGAGAVGYDPEKAFFGPLPRYVSPGGNMSAGAGFLVQMDGGGYDRSGAEDGTVIDSMSGGKQGRRAILIANGLFYNDYIFFGTWDFLDRGERFSDGLRSAMFAWRRFDPLWFMVGQQEIASPMDGARGIRAFMEEAMTTSAFAYAPGTPSVGARISHRGPNHSAAIGYYRVPIREFGDDREGYGVHGRVTYAPIVERTRALHFGVAGYWRQPTILHGNMHGSEQFAARPEFRVDNSSIVVNTGIVENIDTFHFGALEFAGVYGPWSLQGEVHRLNVKRAPGPGGAAWPDLTFNGHYLLGSWFLTGESRNYDQRLGSFWRVRPHKEFDPWGSGGWGAFELAARISHIDLDDQVNLPGGVRGGASDNVSLALNWYFNPYVRLSLNYVHADVDKVNADGVQEGGKMNALGMRRRWEF